MGYAERQNTEVQAAIKKAEIDLDKARAKKDVQTGESLERLKTHPDYKTMQALFEDFEKICRDELLMEYVQGVQGQKVEVPDAEIKLRQKVYNRITWFISLIDSKIEKGKEANKAINEMETAPEEYYRKKHERN